MMEWILTFAARYPHFAVIFMVMGFVRTLFKPMCSVIQAYVDATETKADNLWWSEVQKSKVWGSLLYLIDLFASVKLPKGSE